MLHYYWFNVFLKYLRIEKIIAILVSHIRSYKGATLYFANFSQKHMKQKKIWSILFSPCRSAIVSSNCTWMCIAASVSTFCVVSVPSGCMEVITTVVFGTAAAIGCRLRRNGRLWGELAAGTNYLVKIN